MKRVLLELDEDLARRLDRVTPARSRQRSEFIRDAIRRALWDLEERATAEAYRRQPDSAAEYLDPAAWEPPTRRANSRKRR